MSHPESRRLALYDQLREVLGTESADTLMAYLPSSKTTDLATGSDIDPLRSDVTALVGHLDTRLERVEEDVRQVSRRLDRMQQTMLGRFIAVVAALIAAGFVG